MKRIDPSKKHAVTLTFLLDEKVTPQALAISLVHRCGGSVLQDGEGILIEHAQIACVVTDETLSVPHFGSEWRSAVKKTRKTKP